MHPVRRYRLFGVLGIVLLSSLAAYLILQALSSNTSFFRTPNELLGQQAQSVTLGGVVQEGSVMREGINISFVVTDFKQQLSVRYQGILPDLFREGKGVVVKGYFDGSFVKAKQILAKHDENYMPLYLDKKLK